MIQEIRPLAALTQDVKMIEMRDAALKRLLERTQKMAMVAELFGGDLLPPDSGFNGVSPSPYAADDVNHLLAEMFAAAQKGHQATIAQLQSLGRELTAAVAVYGESAARELGRCEMVMAHRRKDLGDWITLANRYQADADGVFGSWLRALSRKE